MFAQDIGRALNLASMPKPETARRFPPVGRCIYCNSTTPPLSTEHTVADGLGGRLILPKASCEPCRVMTGKFEQRFLRDMMWGLRLAYGTHGSKRPPPDKIRAAIPSEDGSVTFKEVPHQDVATKAVMPVFHKMPGVLVGRDDGPVSADHEQDWVLIVDPAASERMRQAGHIGASIFADVQAFVRTLAKTAHAQSVAKFGINGFEPYLLDLICGRARDWTQFVGCDIPDIGPPERDFETWMQLVIHERTQQVIGRMQFFSSQETPVYVVVVGKLR